MLIYLISAKFGYFYIYCIQIVVCFILDYGTSEVKQLHSQFGAILPQSGEAQLDILLEEWSLLKHLLYRK
jgi:hypothetical protein